jgi:hypothetical protein
MSKTKDYYQQGYRDQKLDRDYSPPSACLSYDKHTLDKRSDYIGGWRDSKSDSGGSGK